MTVREVQPVGGGGIRGGRVRRHHDHARPAQGPAANSIDIGPGRQDCRAVLGYHWPRPSPRGGLSVGSRRRSQSEQQRHRGDPMNVMRQAGRAGASRSQRPELNNLAMSEGGPAPVRRGEDAHRRQGRRRSRTSSSAWAKAARTSAGAGRPASSSCSTAPRTRPRPTACGTSSCPTPRPARASPTSTTPTSPPSSARSRWRRSASTARRPTPATWKCWSGSARPSRRSSG